MKYLLTLILSQFFIQSYAQDNSRYISRVFNDYNFYENITYTEATPYSIEGNQIRKSYKLDFYEPSGDDVASRPLVILFPDGNFVIGNKEQNEIVNWCEALTTYGYACVCVNYRQGYDNSIPEEGVNQAMLRAIQDGRAAIRFFIENQSAFRINIDEIFLGGNQTGAEVALHTAFVDNDSESPSSLECLDCSGNIFWQEFSIAGVLNINGILDNKEIVKNNPNISVLNVEISNSNKLLTTEKVKAFHQYLLSQKIISQFVRYEAESNPIEGFTKLVNGNNINTFIDFLSGDLIFHTESPLGDIEVCENTVETYYCSNDKDSGYEWIVEHGTIESQTDNSLNVRWNKGRGIGKIKVIRTDLKTGAKGKISNPLYIDIASPPIVDFEMQYLSGNIIKVRDKSFEANLFSIDYDFEGQMYQGNPNTEALFSYTQNGRYNLTQTVENICGFVTQTIPVEIQLPDAFNAVNIDKMVEKIPNLINSGSDMRLDVSVLSQIKNFSVIIKDDYNKLVIKTSYSIESITDKLFQVNTSNLEIGTYFMEFSTDETLIMTKRIRIK